MRCDMLRVLSLYHSSQSMGQKFSKVSRPLLSCHLAEGQCPHHTSDTRLYHGSGYGSACWENKVSQLPHPQKALMTAGLSCRRRLTTDEQRSPSSLLGPPKMLLWLVGKGRRSRRASFLSSMWLHSSAGKP